MQTLKLSMFELGTHFESDPFRLLKRKIANFNQTLHLPVKCFLHFQVFVKIKL